MGYIVLHHKHVKPSLKSPNFSLKVVSSSFIDYNVSFFFFLYEKNCENYLNLASNIQRKKNSLPQGKLQACLVSIES